MDLDKISDEQLGRAVLNLHSVLCDPAPDIGAALRKLLQGPGEWTVNEDGGNIWIRNETGVTAARANSEEYANTIVTAVNEKRLREWQEQAGT